MAFPLQPKIEGNEAGETLLFIHGWPDNASLWDETVAAVRDTYRCVRVTLPNFDGLAAAPRGFHTEEIVDTLAAYLRELAKEKPVTLVLHDWGAYWGHMVHHRHPELVRRVVGVDVAPHFKPTPVGALGIVAYQSWLFAAFKAGGGVGDWMTRRFATLFHVPDAATRPLDATMNYPYRNVWEDLLTGRADRLVKGYWPTCPLLFIYGKQKPFQFHTKKWTDHVEKVGGKVVGLPVDHWAMRDPSFVPLVKDWLHDTDRQG